MLHSSETYSQVISTIKEKTGVGFGTSGARGLATAMTDEVCYSYASAFVQLLRHKNEVAADSPIAVGGDLRPSTHRIMTACCKAIVDAGLMPINAGEIASPALAYFGMKNGMPTMMVTGSHIPDDRNGIKFTTKDGEITKAHESGILSQSVEIPSGLFDSAGKFLVSPVLPAINEAPHVLYIRRYVEAFGTDFLQGSLIGVYQHSAVARDLLVELYRALGATVEPLGRSSTFIPVDTEAIRTEDVASAHEWAASERFDAIVSADGDSDRPLLSDEKGNWLRGDVMGILAAKFLEANSVVAPISCNTALEKSGWFTHVVRTKIGSPYVIAGMKNAGELSPSQAIVGYEANGGFLLGSPIKISAGVLESLPTRDAVLPQLCVLGLARKYNLTISALLKTLPDRFTASDRVKEFSTERSKTLFESICSGDSRHDFKEFKQNFPDISAPVSIDYTDGARFSCFDETIVHLRASGNAPELRCYTETTSPQSAKILVENVLAQVLLSF